MQKINWGIIGLGSIALQFSKSFSQTQNANLLGVASRNESKLKKFGEYFDIEKKFLFKNYQDLIDCEKIDIVYISLPNSLHKHWVIKAIKNNKHILVEKPATINYSEVNQIKDHLKTTNLFFSEAFMYRYHPQINSVIEVIKKNKIGNLSSMESFCGKNILTKKKFFFFEKRKKIDPKSRMFKKELGGGCILDLGCYPLSFSLFVGSLINKQNIDNIKILNIKKEIGETGVDVDSYAELIFQDGFKSKIYASFKKNLGNQSIIKGENGSIIINNTWFGGDLVLKINDKSDQIISFETIPNIYAYQIKEISNQLIEGRSKPKFPAMNLHETLLNMQIIEDWVNF